MRYLVLSTLIAGSLAAWAAAADPVAGEFQHLKRLIKPQPGEDAWAQIPWLTNLWEARQRAAAAGKPILLWEMDGHPLGCT